MILNAESFSTELRKSIYTWLNGLYSVLWCWQRVISDDSQWKLWLRMLMCAFISSPRILNCRVIFLTFFPITYSLCLYPVHISHYQQYRAFVSSNWQLAFLHQPLTEFSETMEQPSENEVPTKKTLFVTTTIMLVELIKSELIGTDWTLHLTKTLLATPLNDICNRVMVVWRGRAGLLNRTSVQRKLFPARALNDMTKGKSHQQVCMTS